MLMEVSPLELATLERLRMTPEAIQAEAEALRLEGIARMTAAERAEYDYTEGLPGNVRRAFLLLRQQGRIALELAKPEMSEPGRVARLGLERFERVVATTATYVGDTRTNAPRDT